VTISKKFFTTGLSDIVKISGREPTLYPNLVDLIHELKRIYPKIMLSTNGTGSISLMQSLIDGGVSIFALPFHTNNREKYIRMCGISGKTADRYFDHTQQIIAHLSEQKQEIHLIRVLMRGLNDSVEELDEFIEFCGKYRAMGKIFTLNYHPNIHRSFENNQFVNPASNISALDVFNSLYVDTKSFREYIRDKSIKSDSYSNDFSLRTIYTYGMENGARFLFDSFEKAKSRYDRYDFCKSCPYIKECNEGPYSNGWEITPDLKLQVCPMRSDLTIDLQNPEEIKEISFEGGNLNVIR
jgi:molybdenum cofactor biosynthesis enzyme MoaA